MNLKNSGTFKRLEIRRQPEPRTSLENKATCDDGTYEEVEVEIISDARSVRGGRCEPGRPELEADPGGSASARGWPSSEKTLMWALPVRSSVEAPAVAMLATVGVGGAPEVPLRPVRRAAPTIEANNPTRIFMASPPPAALSEAPSSSEAPKKAQTARAPLLRAFDDRQRSATWWSSAKTMTEAIHDGEGQGGATASVEPVKPVEPVEPGNAKAPRARPQRRRERQRRPSERTKKIAALVVTMAAVVSASTLVPRSILEKVIPGGAISAAAVPARAAPPVEPRAAVEAPTPPPSSAVAPLPPPAVKAMSPLPPEAMPPETMPVETMPPESFTQRAPRIRVAPAPALDDKPAKASRSGGSSEVTLARQAVDALLVGDRSGALRHYRELSRTAPDRRVYREAVRLLSPATSSSPQ